MTELDLAYGYLDEEKKVDNNYMDNLQISQMNNMENNIQGDNKINFEENNNNNIVDKKHRKKRMSNTNYDERPIIQRESEQYTMPQDIPVEYPYKKVNKQPQQQVVYYNTSFWDKLHSKKTEVFKLIMFSLVILLAISFDRLFTFYLSKYINENVLTNNQELLLRLSYPVLIILLLWIFKAL